jgi:hypothetical protein
LLAAPRRHEVVTEGVAIIVAQIAALKYSMFREGAAHCRYKQLQAICLYNDIIDDLQLAPQRIAFPFYMQEDFF